MNEREVAEALGLSEEQRKVLGIEGDAVVAAGAGAGKTTTLVGAVACDLLVGEVPPERLCVCTFTRSAAGGLRSRVAAALDQIGGAATPDTSMMWIGTMDSLASRFLRENALRAGIDPAFRVASEREIRPLRRRALEVALGELSPGELSALDKVTDISPERLESPVEEAREKLQRLGLMYPLGVEPARPDPAEALRAIGELLEEDISDRQAEALRREAQAIADGRLEDMTEGVWTIKKRAVLESRDAAAEARDAFRQSLVDERATPAREAFSLLLGSYIRELAKLKEAGGLFGFSDITEKALALAGETGPVFLRTYIDEAQDTDPFQVRLFGALSAGPVISIGDANQSIYGFRNADVETFRAASEGLERIELRDNYRSRPEVLAAVNALCSPLGELGEDLIEMQPAGSGFADLPAGVPAVEMVLCSKQTHAPLPEEEAASLVDSVLERARERDLRPEDVCILVRSNREVEAYAAAVRSRGVPAIAIQRRGLLAQEECEDLFAYLALLADPGDEAALLRVMSSPFVGLDDTRLAEIAALRSREMRSGLVRGEALPDRGEPGFLPLLQYFEQAEPGWSEEFRQILRGRGQVPVSDLLRRAVQIHRFDLALQLLDETGARLRNIEKMLWVVSEIEQESGGPDPRRVLRLLEEEREADQTGQDSRIPEGLSAVRVMTIHAAKGDEFPLVAAARLSRKAPNHSRPFQVTADGYLGVRLPSASGGSSMPDWLLRADAERTRQRDMAESQRLLYVALTRAQEHLMLLASGSETKAGTKWQEPFASLLDGFDSAAGTLEIFPGQEREGLPVRHLELGSPAGPAGSPGPLDTSAKMDGELPVHDGRLPTVCGQPVSYSRLAAWRRCSLRRHLERDLALKELGTDKNSSSSGSGQRSFGTAVHEALARISWPDLPEDLRSLLAGSGVAPGRIDEAAGLIGELSRHPLFEEIRAAEEIMVEVPFQLPLGDEIVAGRIDLAARRGPEMLIVDWKTGEDPEGVFSEDYELQRKIYALAALLQDEPPARVRVISFDLRGGGQSEDIREADEAEQLRSSLEQTMADIFSRPAAPASQTLRPFCQGCPGQSRICPVSRQEQAPDDSGQKERAGKSAS